MQGWIKLNRSLLDWEWYSDVNVKLTFLHLLITANWKDKNWKGIKIKRGQVLTGSLETSKEIGITRQEYRTAISKLISTGEVTTKSTNKNTLVTIVKYDDYQDLEIEATNNLTNEQPADNVKKTNFNKKSTNNPTNKKTLLSTENTGFNKDEKLSSTNRATNEQPTTNQRLTTTKEYNNINNTTTTYKKVEAENLHRGFKNQIGEHKTQWLESLYQKHKLRKGSISDLLDTFINHLSIMEIEQPNLSEFKKHFIYWLDKQQQLGKLTDYSKRKQVGAL